MTVIPVFVFQIIYAVRLSTVDANLTNHTLYLARYLPSLRLLRVFRINRYTAFLRRVLYDYRYGFSSVLAAKRLI